MPKELSPLALPISIVIMAVLYYFVYRWQKKSNREMKDKYPNANHRTYSSEVEEFLSLDQDQKT